ncbi:AI-2E family transporter [Jeotgalibacillus sp. S-D1]|uniref:AI-2E family transporter n=1 Tax=Jeotgalibacillus sp. S-D1 TaxID=2552189 RepID=UPI001059FD8F|nr:AI-2E family transporter [Jeotgalibacillus sp. S-D1]TDL34456.1 AI-2E family transporter [Jeotgalibacillus sp. S-D1]
MDNLLKKWLSRIIVVLLLLLCAWIVSILWPVIKPVLSGIWLAIVPLFLSILIAYLLVPFVHLLKKGNCSDLLAVWIVFIILFSLIGMAVQWGVPVLIREWNHFLVHMPSIMSQISSWNSTINSWIADMPGPVSEMVSKAINRLQERIENRVEGVMGGVDHSFKWIIALSLVPFMSFYLLKDRKMIGERLLRLMPVKRKDQILKVSRELDQRLGGYVRGQLWLSLAVAAVSFAALYLIDLPYALPLAGIMGVFNVIPYIGPVIGAFPAILIASTVSGSMIIWVLISAFGIQMVESHLLAPWIMGKNVHIHPVVIMILLLVGGELAGMLGLIIAVPLFMVVTIISRSFFKLHVDERIDK